jgi:hypothetical protein
MEEKEYISRLLWEWAEARAAANENTTLMVKAGFTEPVMQECAARMQRLYRCEDEMLSLNHSIPQALQNYIDARMDRGCSACWLSSAGTQHLECERKIDRYFQTEKELYEYARLECDPADLTDLKAM